MFSGKVDATVEVKIDRRPKIKRHRPDTGNQVQTKVMPLELKTGKMFTKLGEFEKKTTINNKQTEKHDTTIHKSVAKCFYTWFGVKATHRTNPWLAQGNQFWPAAP